MKDRKPVLNDESNAFNAFVPSDGALRTPCIHRALRARRSATEQRSPHEREGIRVGRHVSRMVLS
eukprot:6186283-Pleurochrysis_carterae.AAC.1